MVKKIIIVLLFIGVLTFSCDLFQPTVEELFPLIPGSQWVYSGNVNIEYNDEIESYTGSAKLALSTAENYGSEMYILSLSELNLGYTNEDDKDNTDYMNEMLGNIIGDAQIYINYGDIGLNIYGGKWNFSNTYSSSGKIFNNITSFDGKIAQGITILPNELLKGKPLETTFSFSNSYIQNDESTNDILLTSIPDVTGNTVTTLAEETINIITSAGSFENCRAVTLTLDNTISSYYKSTTFEYDYDTVTLGTMNIYFVKNIGLIKIDINVTIKTYKNNIEDGTGFNIIGSLELTSYTGL